MIRRFFCAILALSLLLAGGAWAEGVSDFVRLHVVAEDDTPAAQALKLALRDCCLSCAAVCLDGAPDADAAYARLEAHLDDFQSACAQCARELGYTGGITVRIGTFDFPDRLYGDLRVPAGRYRALRVVIGSGEGHNWWCVLYPSLCLLDENIYAAETEGYYSRLLRWLSARIGGLL